MVATDLVVHELLFRVVQREAAVRLITLVVEVPREVARLASLTRRASPRSQASFILCLVGDQARLALCLVEAQAGFDPAVVEAEDGLDLGLVSAQAVRSQALEDAALVETKPVLDPADVEVLDQDVVVSTAAVWTASI